MNITPRAARWGPLLLATVAAIASISVFGWVADSAGAQAAHDHSDLAHHHGFSGPGDVADWPPRPATANADLVPADGVVATGPGLRAEAAATPARYVSGLDAALGTDWVHISSAPGRAGKDDVRPDEEVYFSRDLNQTVIVLFWPDGPEITTYPADEVQPIVSAAERAAATELGRQWLLDEGFDEATDLEGFGIRALDDGELFPVRMVYITYAASWFDDPLYGVYVDMTNLVVADGGQL